MNARFWAGRRVLVTGHTGFKGAWLAFWLHRMGSAVVGFALGPPTDPSLCELLGIEDLVTSVHGDLRDAEAVRRVIADHAPEIVIHMAAQPIVRRALRDPLEAYAVNVLGTVHVLEAVRRSGQVRVAINVTTDKVYENHEWEWGYRETDRLGGSDPYSTSKACSELVTQAYARSLLPVEGGGPGTAVAAARAGNVIGGGDWAEDRLVPDLMRAGLDGSVVRIRNPRAIRPWQHVLNPLEGYLTLAERLWEGECSPAFNFGPADDEVRPVDEIADRVSELWGEGLSWELEGAPQPREAHHLRLDSSRAHAELGWRPRLDLDEGLRWVVRWFQAYRDGEDLTEITARQIGEYAARAEAAVAQAETG